MKTVSFTVPGYSRSARPLETGDRGGRVRREGQGREDDARGAGGERPEGC
jgi:hypothetical protein